LRVQCAISGAVAAITRTITVAAGAFAPGHLGELAWIVPFELVDSVLEDTGTEERRLRLLPSRVGVYFLLALGLFPRRDGHQADNSLVRRRRPGTSARQRSERP
jgi:Insertion element 4 transposase N-terminal